MLTEGRLIIVLSTTLPRPLKTGILKDAVFLFVSNIDFNFVAKVNYNFAFVKVFNCEHKFFIYLFCLYNDIIFFDVFILYAERDTICIEYKNNFILS